VARCLLSGQNPRETFGLMYPLTGSYFSEFMGHRQYEYVLRSLAGSTAELDLSTPAMVVVGGYLYVNVTSMMRNIALVLPTDPTSVGAPRGLVTTDVRPRLTTRLLLPFRIWRVYCRTAHTNRVVIPRYREFLDDVYWRLRSCDSECLGEQDLATIDRLFHPANIADAISFLTAYNIMSVLHIAVSRLVSERAPNLLNLLVGYGTSTALLGERMWHLGQVARQCGQETIDLLRRGETDMARYQAMPAAAPLLQAIERFLRTYGHRAFQYSSDFDATRLADQPGLVLLAIGGLLEEGEPPSARAVAARRVGQQALQKMNPIRRFSWRQLLRIGSGIIGLRERGRDTLELQNATYGLAARLLSRYYFPDQPSDHLWFYTFGEFLSFGRSHGRERVQREELARRRAEMERNRQQPMPPELIWYDPDTGEWWPLQEAGGDTSVQTSGLCLQGIAASAGGGCVEGIALVTNSAQEAAERLLVITGAVVLVTHVTDPVWSSLFRRLVAVVTEMGGAISHAAIVARENGIPAVVGVRDATRLLRDGQRVRVDGTAGTVEVV
jgi:phosphohistidine swiveling domain-containing protein